ncbi:FliM/FliN family flagellar motor switch protein [Chelativorans sp. AA-79]|uniref:FliM/FliN family flagellar motor switch protein n=1 Tax=Chelativorans sp. AA-79 TaxID=3028735 RepID=UPI0023F6A5C2|nr:FliM/FliN family flagellar motor switch protein [Chelativorans sp. AA-79]WEX08299.1 FliM/FliN family flagellar motor switch protein [Chelativorans sp. AA-79]
MTAAPDNQALMRNLVVERLVGATGDPRQVVEAARGAAMRALPAVQQVLGERFSPSLAVDIADIDDVRLSEARPGQDSFDALVVVPAASSPDALTMRLDPQALSLLVSIFLGGDPDIPPPPLDRPPSRIELDVAALAFEAFAEALNGTGGRSLGLRLPVSQPLAGPVDFRRFVVRDGPGVRISFSLQGGRETGLLTAWIPHRVILETRVSAGRDAPGAPAPAEWRQRFGDEVMRSKVEVTATIPLTKLSLGALAELREGQVLALHDTAPAQTRLSVRNRGIFVCEFGKLGQNYTVRIKQPFDDRQDVIEGLLAGQTADVAGIREKSE